jgi:hypothetical protein
LFTGKERDFSFPSSPLCLGQEIQTDHLLHCNAKLYKVVLRHRDNINKFTPKLLNPDFKCHGLKPGHKVLCCLKQNYAVKVSEKKEKE